MTPNTLPPRSVGAVLGESFRLYGKNFLKFLAIVAIFQGSSYVLGRILESSPLYLRCLCSAAVSVGVYPWMEGALIYSISQHYLGQATSVGGAYRFALRRLRTLVLATVLVFSITVGSGLVVAIGAYTSGITVVAPAGALLGLYLLVNWLFVSQAVLVEGVGTGTALLRGPDLVKNNWWRVLGMAIVVYGIPVALVFIAKATSLLATAGLIVWGPVTVTARTLLYYELRREKEGYDLEQLASELQPKD